MWIRSSFIVAGMFAVIVFAQPHPAAMQGGKPGSNNATLVTLPSLGSNAQARGINAAGTVIVGDAFDTADCLRAVKWTLQSGTWVIEQLGYPGSTAAARAVDTAGNVAGYDDSVPRTPVLWPAAGGYQNLGCNPTAGLFDGAHALSDAAQQVVGQEGGRAAVWSAPGYCAEFLPALYPGGGGSPTAIDASGAIAGGSATPGPKLASVPVRWVRTDGAWRLEQLDTRPGRVTGASAQGDLGGQVSITCRLTEGCGRGMIWYADGRVRELGTLGGDHSWVYDVNSNGEAVGVSSARNTNTAFIWSEAMGMVKLPIAGWGAAFAVSDVRADGTRIVAGTNSHGDAVIWVVRNP